MVNRHIICINEGKYIWKRYGGDCIWIRNRLSDLFCFLVIHCTIQRNINIKERCISALSQRNIVQFNGLCIPMWSSKIIWSDYSRKSEERAKKVSNFILIRDNKTNEDKQKKIHPRLIETYTYIPDETRRDELSRKKDKNELFE